MEASGKKRKSLSRSKEVHKRPRVDNSDLINKLAEQVSGIQQFLSQNFSTPVVAPSSGINVTGENNDNADSDVSVDVSEELYNELSEAPPAPLQPQSEFSFSVNTVLKDPVILQSDPTYVDRLKSIQYFDSNQWVDVRYSDVQKKYVSTPGFTELECNDEIKAYD